VTRHLEPHPYSTFAEEQRDAAQIVKRMNRVLQLQLMHPAKCLQYQEEMDQLNADLELVSLSITYKTEHNDQIRRDARIAFSRFLRTAGVPQS